MTQSRKTQILLDATPYYHCYTRCVRRAYLCGDDHSSGANYDHRKQWITSRLRFLSYIYAIDLCAYAVLSNHYHIVLRVDEQRALSWSAEEVAERWMQLYKGHMLVDRWLAEPKALDKTTLAVVGEIIEGWRERLCDLSWFMRGVNECIARMANAEDNCKGRFWEGRFKSQALLDEAALLSCMTYVDLNPIRAGIEQTLINSDFTSIQQRLYDYSKYKRDKTKTTAETTLAKRIHKQQTLKTKQGLASLPEAPLMPFDGSSHTLIHTALPFTREDYFELVEQTGRIIRVDKRGFIPKNEPSILVSLGIDTNNWIEHIQKFGRTYATCAGSVDNILNFAEMHDRQWCKGLRNSAKVFKKMS